MNDRTKKAIYAVSIYMIVAAIAYYGIFAALSYELSECKATVNELIDEKLEKIGYSYVEEWPEINITEKE